MAKVVGVVVVGIMLVLAVGIILPLFTEARSKAAVVGCRENLRQISLFAAQIPDPRAKGNPARPPAVAVPAGTVFLPNTPPDERLSWLAAVLPGLNQHVQPTEPLVAAIDRNRPWPVPANQAAAATVVKAFLCPGNPPAVVAGGPAPTQYVGIAGLGADAAALPIGPVPFDAGVFGRFNLDAVSPRAGCFRYDSPTPFALVTDGLSQTFLVGETAADPGPWLRGGPATVRGLDDAAGARPLLGDGGQFGGNHPGVSNWAFADGSARPFSDRTDPAVLKQLATIAGGDSDVAEW